MAMSIAPRAAAMGVKNKLKGSNQHKDIEEYLWVSKEERLVVIAWWYKGNEMLEWKRDFKDVANKSILLPLSFANSKDKSKTIELNTKKMIESRNDSWW